MTLTNTTYQMSYPSSILKKALLFLSMIVTVSINAQTSYTFTPAGATGQSGPSQSMVNNSYTNTSLSGSVTVSSGIQSFTVPVSGIYRIKALGARGGNSGGLGADIQGDFSIAAGTVLKVLVGQQGGGSSGRASGGGASYVTYTNNSPLVVAGGGGGNAGTAVGIDATITTTANSGYSANNGLGASYNNFGLGGVNGNGATNGLPSAGAPHAGNGGGLNTSGANGQCGGAGIAFVLGGTGGSACWSYVGAFGGGGGDGNSGGGGGGGYSGGGGSYHNPTNGGGGSSYNGGTNPVNTASVGTGNGVVVITRLSGVNVNQTSQIACFGNSNAVLVAAAQGGTAPYTYTWLPGGVTSATLNNASAGTYTVYSTDAGAVTYSTTFVVSQPPVLSTAAISQNSITCYGGNDGAASISVSGGTGAYTYSWSPSGGTSSSASGLTAGVYTVVARDANNCAASRTFTISQPSPLNVLGFATSNVVCFGDQSVLIGAGALTYVWSHGVTNGVSFTPASTAVYTVTGTDSKGCTGKAMVTITVNPKPSVAISGTNVICSGNVVNLIATGANTYTWNNSNQGNALSDMPSSTTSYTVWGTNSNGCTNSAVKTVSVINSNPTVGATATFPQVCLGKSTTVNGTGAVSYTWTGGISNNVAFSPTATTTYSVIGSNACGTGMGSITITVNPLPFISANSSTPAVCLGSTVALSGSGGVSYSWSSGVTNNVAFLPFNTANYTVTGTDSKGCQNTAITTVTVYSLPFVSANASATVICLGNSVTLFGGGASTYVWNNGVTNGIAFAPSNTATYNVTGTDGNGCKNVASKTVSVVTPPLLVANASTVAVCAGNAVTLYGSGASSYTWSGGISNNVAFVPSATTVYTLSGSNACGTTTTSINITVHPLPAVTANASSTVVCIGSPATLYGGGASTYTWTGGITNNVAFVPGSTATYTVVGTNSNGCKNSASKTVSVIPLPVITATASPSTVCFGSSVTLNAQGGVTYTWSNGVPNNTSFVPSVTANYTVYGTNASGCTNSAVRSVTVYQLPVVGANANANQVCLGNSLMLYGSGAHTYTWAGGYSNGVSFFPNATSSYSVSGTNTVTGCTSTNNAVVTVTVNPLPVITASATFPSVCQGQSTALYGGGGDTYTWSGGRINGQLFIPSSTTSYYVTGTNTLTGCVNVAMVTVTVNPRPVISASLSAPQVCAGSTVAVYGMGAHTYTWSAGIQDGVPFTAMSTNNYFATGTNTITGCQSQNTAIITVNVNQPPTIQVVTNNSVVCSGSPVTLQVYGATTYTWSDGISAGIPFTPSASAVYTVSGTNAQTGCSNTRTFAITVNPLPTITPVASNTQVCIGNNVILTATGANIYTFSPGVFYGVPFTPTVTKTYTVIGQSLVTGCTNTVPAAITITVNPLPVVSGFSNPTVVCHGSTVTLNGVGADTYTWTNGVINNVPFTPLIATTYSVTGTNTTTGCKSNNPASVTLSLVPIPTVFSSGSAAEICQGATVTLSGSGAHTYTWTGGVANGVPFTPSATASYTVVGTDTVTGCNSNNLSVQNIIVKALPVLTVLQSDSSVCEGESVILVVKGGLTYSWSTGGTTGTITVAPAVTTIYTVTGLGPNGCYNSTTVTQEVSPCTGLDASSLNASALSIFPNPNAGVARIHSDRDIRVSLYSELGQLLATYEVNGGTEEVLHLEHLANGIYFLKGGDGIHVFSTKVIVNK